MPHTAHRTPPSDRVRHQEEREQPIDLPFTDPGNLRQQVSIQQPTESPNSFGEPISTWSTVATVWAKVETLAGRELFAAQRIAAEVTHQVTIRYYAGILPKWRLLLAGRAFDINAVLNIDERNIELRLLCKEAQ